MSVEQVDQKKELIVEFLKSLIAIENEMALLREQRNDLKQSYRDEPLLTNEDVKYAIKALRMWQKDENLDDINEYLDLLEEQVGE